MDRYRVQRRRTRRLEARALSRRAWVVVMLVDRTDRAFSNEAVEESSFCRRRVSQSGSEGQMPRARNSPSMATAKPSSLSSPERPRGEMKKGSSLGQGRLVQLGSACEMF